ncbi:substrate-binding domain-containing protein [Riemerella anatipestifer]|uniref:substrate-binding domain-containing protein n=1 Tax=Riemerella anatipestifer TaxID=34085 RepID=UPI002A8C95EB|nr:substrate-binding domain-containing protein [Riemerella anatipestifer]MDY3525261.1 substrate-binding domain-containing protein [Riemerella anatipestifer]
MKQWFLFIYLVICVRVMAQADTLYVYGPGGPYAPINEAAQIFAKRNNLNIKVTKGPFSQWKDKARNNAHLIYSGAEFMMTQFISELGNVQQQTVYPLYLRKSGLIVRKGNPKNIKTLKDLMKPELRIMVVNGAGLTGVWEDIAGKTQDIEVLRKIRKNIVLFAENSGQAQSFWAKNPNIDVWISWNIWQKNNNESADFVSLEDRYTTYRDCGIALTAYGKANPKALEFYQFLKSKEVQVLFEKQGWIEQNPSAQNEKAGGKTQKASSRKKKLSLLNEKKECLLANHQS